MYWLGPQPARAPGDFAVNGNEFQLDTGHLRCTPFVGVTLTGSTEFPAQPQLDQVPLPAQCTPAASPAPRLDIVDELHHILASPEPAVVFSSLAKLCVETFSDSCVVDLVEDDGPGYRIGFPRNHDGSHPATAGPNGDLCGSDTSFVVNTPIKAAANDGHPAYSGLMSHGWAEHLPTRADAAIAALLVQSAIDTIYRQRLIELAGRAKQAIEHLQVALTSNRSIGVAIGILMRDRMITEAQAHEVLRCASQHRHRKIADLASDIAYSGYLSPGPEDGRTSG